MSASLTPQELQRWRVRADAVELLDVRRRAIFEAAVDTLPGAVWRDPDGVDAWAGEIGGAMPVVVYCVHGHQVSQGVANALAACGVEARYLEGGIEGWRDAGLELQPVDR